MPPNLVVTMKKSSAVSHAVVGNFRKHTELSLIVANVREISLFEIESDKLTLIREYPVNGRINGLDTFRPPGEEKDCVVILTAKYQLAVLEFNSGTGEFNARVTGHVHESCWFTDECFFKLRSDGSGMIGFRSISDSFRILPWNKVKFCSRYCSLNNFIVRLRGGEMIDVVFLKSSDTQLVYIYNDSKGTHLQFCEVHLHQETLLNIAEIKNLTITGDFLIPVSPKFDGVIVVGKKELQYLKPNNPPVSCCFVFSTTFVCFARNVDDEKQFYLGDDCGNLFVVKLIIDEETENIKKILIDLLGETSIARCLVHLGGNNIFVGSHSDDSQLIRFNFESFSYKIEVLQTFSNISPVNDFITVEQNSQLQLVTCSGSGKSGSLRVISNGVGVRDKSSVYIPDIQRIFTVNAESEHSKYVIISTDDASHVLKTVGEELEVVTPTEVESDFATLFAGLMEENNAFIQVTTKTLKISQPKAPAITWRPLRSEIDHVAVNLKSGQIVAACEATLFYLKYHASEHSIEQSHTSMECNEIACLAISEEENGVSKYVAVGYWGANTFALLALPHFMQTAHYSDNTTSIPRSLLIATLEDITYLFVSLGDGHLLYLIIDEKLGFTEEISEVYGGTQYIRISKFVHGGKTQIFVGSEHPMLITTWKNKLIFNYILSPSMYNICSLNSEVYRNYCITSNEEVLNLSEVDLDSRIHIRSIPLGESVDKIAYQEETETYGISCIRKRDSVDRSISKLSPTVSGYKAAKDMCAYVDSNDELVSSFVLLSSETFEPLHTYLLGPHERISSIISTRLGDDSTAYYILGTVRNSNSGRIIILEVISCGKSDMKKVFELEMKGCPFSIYVAHCTVVVALNSGIHTYSWCERTLRLHLENMYTDTFASSTQMKMNSNGILVNHLVRSLCVLEVNGFDVQERARDYNVTCATAVEFIDRDTTISGEDSLYIYISHIYDKRQWSAIEEKAQFYLGEVLSVFRKGCLRSHYINTKLQLDKQIMFATLDGTIGLIGQIPLQYADLLTQLYAAVRKHVVNCTGIPQSAYREVSSKYSLNKAYGFIDADLIESILTMPQKKQKKILDAVKIPEMREMDYTEKRHEILQLIEDIARNH